ncbi:hypothetical protein [Streptomyces yangpuensis]|uniref:hypothetical protein n=1 Tax=Streptomyces yangpuensis TaxID=1648182 RepID=UPI0037102663
MREVAVECGGSVRGAVRRLRNEEHLSEGVQDSDVLEMISAMWEAFDVTLGQARVVSQWMGLGSGGSLSDERLELEIGRLVPRGVELDLGVLDRGREELRLPRRAVLVGDHRSLPLRFHGDFFTHRYEAHLGLLILRGWGGETIKSGSLVEIEFQHVQGMRVAPEYRGGLFLTDSVRAFHAADADVVAEMDAFVPSRTPQPFTRLLLSDGKRWDFVVCHSVRAYRFDLPLESEQ